MLQKEMSFSTEHICPALCLPCPLQNKDLSPLLDINQESRDELLETAKIICPRNIHLPSPSFPCQQEKVLFLGLQALRVVSGLTLLVQYPQLVA